MDEEKKKKGATRTKKRGTPATIKKTPAAAGKREQQETEESDAGNEIIFLDASWVAVMVLIAFFAGFYINGVVGAGSSGNEAKAVTTNQTIENNTLGVCPVTGNDGKSGKTAPALTPEQMNLATNTTKP